MTDSPPPNVAYSANVDLLRAIAVLNAKPVGDRMMIHVGKISYSIYLTHFIVILACLSLVPPALAAIVPWLALGATLAVSHLLFAWVERPCMALARRLTEPHPTTGDAPRRPPPFGITRPGVSSPPADG